MDTNIATTRIAASTPQGAGVTAPGKALGGGNGVFSALGGMNFIDLIFARISEGQDLKNETSGMVAAPLQSAPDLSTPGLLNQVIDQDIANIDQGALINAENIETAAIAPLAPVDIADPALMDGTTGLPATDTPANNPISAPVSAPMQQLRDYLATLLNGVPADQRPQIVEINTAEFKQILTDLKADLDAGNPALIATGLTPGKLSALMEKLESAEKNGTLQSLIMVKILPPQAHAQDKPLPLLLPRALISIQNQAQNGEMALPEPDKAVKTSALNALVVMNQAYADQTTLTKQASLGTASVVPGGMSAESNAAIDAQIDDQGADAADEMATDGKTAKDDGKNIPSAAEKAPTKNNPAISAGLSAISNNGLGSIETAGNWAEALPENMDISASIGVGAKPLSAATSALASVSNAATHAAYPHPATQAVAASISKNAQSADSKEFTIQLDPPELGRVEVKMAIDKNNALKAHLIIEKPETFMMLQRDAQILERSLQGIGMDTGDSGISFELAQDNMFQNEGERGGERYQASSKSGGAEKIDEVIETTMTWHVDPETGMQRYNILA